MSLNYLAGVKQAAQRYTPSVWREAATLWRRLLLMTPGHTRGRTRARELLTASAIAELSAEASRVPLPANAETILFFSLRGWPNHIALECLLAAMHRANGFAVRFSTCEGALPFTMMDSINTPHERRRPCAECFRRKKLLIHGNFPCDVVSGALDGHAQAAIETLQTIGECRAFAWRGAPLGRLCWPSMVWYSRRSRLTDADVPVYRDALRAGLMVQSYFEESVVPMRPRCVIMLNGEFFAEGIAAFILAKNGLRFVTHEYTVEGRLVAALNQSVPQSMACDKTRPMPTWQPPRTLERSATSLLAAWHARGGYAGDLWRGLWDTGSTSGSVSVQATSPTVPMAVLYPNLTFESSVVGRDRVFMNQFEWLDRVLAHFRAHPEWRLTIRFHPGEMFSGGWKTNESLEAYVQERHEVLPENVTLVSARNPYSSYELGQNARVVLVYSSTLGLELAERGKAVITAAQVHYAERGITHDPRDESEYFALLDSFMTGSSPASGPEPVLVRRYVAWLFFRRFLMMEPLGDTLKEGFPVVKVRSLRKLRRMPNFGAVVRLIEHGEEWW